MHTVGTPSAPAPAYLYKSTPQAASHAPYTPLGFSLGFPPHDHPLFLPQRPSQYSPAPGAALARTGYAYASDLAYAPHAPCPLPPPAQRAYLHKVLPDASIPGPQPAALCHGRDPTMAISLFYAASRPQSATAHPAGASSSDGGSHHGGGSDGGRDPTPPEERHERERPRESKKKIHHCWMCHKSFDRPSTLKKVSTPPARRLPGWLAKCADWPILQHLLVHTGEKAFACESCGRRFGVASNLNRHAKTCRAANPGVSATAPAASSSSPAASTSQAAGASPSTSSDVSAIAGIAPVPPASPSSSATASQLTTATASTTTTTTSESAPATVAAPASASAPRRPSRKRKAAASEETNASEMSPERQTRSRKRARRAPSPSLWVPDSLKAFDLTPLAKGTPVPLPPVRPFQENNQLVEERDSYDENASANPYHPRGWKGRLPGPGLMGTNVANRAGGQLLIF
ncbi:hypothetical protein C8Q77DRAFT_17864 [Trametes polyzona]|nr:hypothetical protein C8Q77DRAFT_17864 [Trametes polyzona]